jgi:hypothetical protein
MTNRHRGRCLREALLTSAQVSVEDRQSVLRSQDADAGTKIVVNDYLVTDKQSTPQGTENAETIPATRSTAPRQPLPFGGCRSWGKAAIAVGRSVPAARCISSSAS